MNPYKILGVSESASEADIKRARKRLCLKYHPDQGGDENMFRRVNEAYDMLMSGNVCVDVVRNTADLVRQKTIFEFY